LKFPILFDATTLVNAALTLYNSSMRTLRLRWLVVGLLCVIVLAQSFNALAQATQEKTKTPGDFILSELALGAFSAALGWGTSLLTTSPWRDDSMSCPEDSKSFYWCVLALVSVPTVTAPIGVIAMGELNGVSGNIPFAILGTAIAGLSLFSCAAEPHGIGRTFWCNAIHLGGFGLIITPTVLATLGYNWRAQMQTSLTSNLSITLPILTTRF
jgi:hypothetical protein